MTRENPNALKCQIKASALEVSYADFLALQIDTLDIVANTLAIIGHNGAGKSTLIKALLKLLPLHKGSLEAELLTDNGPQVLSPTSTMAFCPETGAVFEDIKIEAYIRLWCRVKLGQANYYKKAGASIMEQLEIAPLLSKLGRELSKGQRRRVQTAIGFLTQPKLFLFDEPFEGLDVQKARELGNIMIDKASEMAFVLATHRMDIVERLADYVLVLKDGKLVTQGSVTHVASALAGQSIVLRQIADVDSLLPPLRRTFTKAVINRVGDQVAIVGGTLEASDIRRFCEAQGFKDIAITLEQPSLVDALNHHLQGY